MVIKINYTSSDVYVSTSVSPVYVVVNYSGVSTGGGVWGQITGTLSNQTDLQTALDAKFDDPTGTTAQYLRGDGSLATFPSLTGYVPYTGATTNVNLGEFELKAGQVEFDQTPTGTAGVGVMRWNDSDGTIDLGLKGGNVTLQVGQEQVQRVVNKSGINLLEANYQVVRVSDAQGQRLAVQLAQGNNDANSTDTIGIVTETINDNQEGFVTTSGLVRNINTTGSLQGETWIDGDVLYLSPTVAGRITKVKPTAPNHSVILGYVVYAHANNGKIFVKVDNGYEIGELHDVYVPTPSNNDGIFWNTANSRYQNNSIAGVLGYTPISGSGATGQVAYWNGTNSQTGSNNLFWNSANNRLGINTSTPTSTLHVVGTAYITENLRFDGQLRDNRDNGIIQQSLSSVVTNRILTIGNGTYLNINFPNGNILLGTTTDGGQRLQVQGTSYFSDRIGFNSTATTNVTLRNELPISGSTNSFGYYTSSIIQSGVTSSASYFYISPTTQAASFTLSRLSGFEVNALSIGSGSTITEASAFYGNIASGTGRWNLYMAGTADNYLAGKLLIGTTTVSTFLLDVNGTARVSGNLTLGGSYRVLYFGASSNSYIVGENNDGLYFSGKKFEFSDTTTKYGRYQRVSGVTSFLIGEDGAGRAAVASSILELFSSTQGFLPPRMTSTQRTAISSPAVGLIVYQTDSTEGLYEYTSAGWANLNGVVTNRQTASYTLALTDVNDLVEMNVATANNLTVPLNSSVAFPIGTKIDVAQYGAGQTTVVATSGVTVRSAGGALKLTSQYSGATLVKIATDEWYLFGNITI